jgi:hypothetical protein
MAGIFDNIVAVAGGGGDAHHLRQDLATLARWPMQAAARPAVVNALLKIVLDPNRRPREQIAAARVLVSMDSLNITAENAKRPAIVNIVQQAMLGNVDLETLTDEQLAAIISSGGTLAAAEGAPKPA